MTTMFRALVVAGLSLLATAALAQQITTHDIGPFTGSLGIVFPPSPCTSSDVVTFGGNVNVVAQVDATENTVDLHLNLQDVKGSGSNGTYVANGAADLLSQPYSGSVTVSFHANVFPPNPCRSGFNSEGALPIAVQLTFDENHILTGVNAVLQCTTDVCFGQ